MSQNFKVKNGLDVNGVQIIAANGQLTGPAATQITNIVSASEDTWVRTAANSSSSYANSAYTQANTATTNAATADQRAVTSGSYANSAYAQANTATTNASTADQRAVTSGSYANSAYTQANTATTNAATADQRAVTSGSYANSAYTAANSAYTAANTKFNSSGGTISGDVNVTGNLTVTGQTTYANTTTVNLGDAIITLNADIGQSSAPSENAGIEIDRGSSANVSVLWNESTDSWTFTNDGTNYSNIGSAAAESYANSAYTQANTATTNAATADQRAVTSGSYANSAFDKANTGTILAQAAYDKANTGGRIMGTVVANTFIANTDSGLISTLNPQTFTVAANTDTNYSSNGFKSAFYQVTTNGDVRVYKDHLGYGTGSGYTEDFKYIRNANTSDSTPYCTGILGGVANTSLNYPDDAFHMANGEVAIITAKIIATSPGAAGSNLYDGTKTWEYKISAIKNNNTIYLDYLSTSISNTGNSGTWDANVKSFINSTIATAVLAVEVKGEDGKQIVWASSVEKFGNWNTLPPAVGGGGGR